MKVAAILCTRNEALHVESTLRDLIAEGIEVALIDHNSTDGTLDIARPFLGNGLISIEHLAFDGTFSLTSQLQAKWELAQRLNHDWLMHVDADEWHMAPSADLSLVEAIAQVDRDGYNCINFNEFVFVPGPGEDLTDCDYRRTSTRYYFFRPRYPFAVRAWKHDGTLDNRRNAGHEIDGDARLYPIDFHMRHYIFLSEHHAREKYLTRRFAQEEIERGWHGDKLRASSENLVFTEDARIRTLSHWTSRDFDISEPHWQHFWEWNGHHDL